MSDFILVWLVFGGLITVAGLVGVLTFSNDSYMKDEQRWSAYAALFGLLWPLAFVGLIVYAFYKAFRTLRPKAEKNAVHVNTMGD